VKTAVLDAELERIAPARLKTARNGARPQQGATRKYPRQASLESTRRSSR
jgi:hypothetical protein